MNDAVPGGHPGLDVLADLAAEVLPLDQAREVEAHVMSCPGCERLLADSEHVRALLAVPDPGPMPDDVWARIDAALADELAQQTQALPTRGWFDTSEPPLPDAAPAVPARPEVHRSLPRGEATDPATRPLPTSRPAPGAGDPPSGSPAPPPPPPPAPPAQLPQPPQPPPAMSFDEAPTAAWKAFLTEPAPPAPPEPVQQRVGRAVRSMRSRRDVRTESGGTRWTRPGVLLGAAAAGVTVLGLGGLGLMMMLGGDPGQTATDALPGTPSRQVLRASGTDYTASTLADQTKALVAGRGAASSSASSNAAANPSQAPLKPGTVADPQQLAACLGALGEGDRQPLVVDLARYQGREAAVIVLAGRQGGYDVWVVARDCRPGVEGHLAYKSVPG